MVLGFNCLWFKVAEYWLNRQIPNLTDQIPSGALCWIGQSTPNVHVWWMCPGKETRKQTQNHKISMNNYGWILLSCCNFGMLSSPPVFASEIMSSDSVAQFMPLQPSDRGVLFLVQVFRTTLYLGYGRKKNMAGPTIPCLRQDRRIGFPSSWIMIISNILAIYLGKL